MIELGLPVILAGILALVHFMGEELEEFAGEHKEKIISLASGVSVTYIFAQLLPEYQRIVAHSGELMFIAPLLGFSSIHISEKIIAKKGLNQEEMRREYSDIHSAFLLFYHGAIGFLLASLLANSTTSGLLFFMPILFHSSVSSFSFTELHEEISQRLGVKLTVSLAPVVGVITHSTGILSAAVFNPVFGVVTGMFIYVVIRDSIPSDDDGQPVEYVLGALAYLVVIAAVRMMI